MAAKRDLLAALREKAKITDRGIRKRREKLQRLVPIPTDIATYILAHRAGVPIRRFLDDATLASVSSWEAQLAQKESRQQAATPTSPRGVSAKHV